ncbi:hypothetical protein D9757_005900 [Collybiopsis confluens]|uniref:Uncharacterized protein n=1 Tax=Collybiopsis confluens TaxID=2823264 RepID=A0A8H5MA89_9AGAR|nr:hypothetical protein D9757_005900 [Collybiopsis confluens]
MLVRKSSAEKHSQGLALLESGLPPSASQQSGSFGHLNVDPFESRRSVPCGVRKAEPVTFYGLSDNHATVLENTLRTDSFDVRPLVDDADPFPKDFFDGHYVSEPYDTFENSPHIRDGVFLSGRYISLDIVHPQTSTMNAPRPQDLGVYYDYSSPSTNDETYQFPLGFPAGDFEYTLDYSPSCQLEITSQDYLNHCRIPAPSFHNAEDFTQSYTRYPEITLSAAHPPMPRIDDSFGEHTSNFRSDHTSYQSQTLHEFELGFNRLRSHRPAESRLHEPDPRLVTGLATAPVRQIVLPKKQNLACHFCRERKIACGKPVPGTLEGPCNALGETFHAPTRRNLVEDSINEKLRRPATLCSYTNKLSHRLPLRQNAAAAPLLCLARRNDENLTQFQVTVTHRVFTESCLINDEGTTQLNTISHSFQAIDNFSTMTRSSPTKYGPHALKKTLKKKCMDAGMTHSDAVKLAESSCAPAKVSGTSRRNPGRMDGVAWRANSFICPDRVDSLETFHEERYHSESDEDSIEDYVNDSRLTGIREHIVSLLDMAKPAKLKGIAKDYEVVKMLKFEDIMLFDDEQDWDTLSVILEEEWEDWEDIYESNGNGPAAKQDRPTYSAVLQNKR